VTDIEEERHAADGDDGSLRATEEAAAVGDGGRPRVEVGEGEQRRPERALALLGAERQHRAQPLAQRQHADPRDEGIER
jgi:hypothetical protein